MADALSLESLGFTKEELQERVIDRICGQVMRTVSSDEDGNDTGYESEFSRKIKEAVSERLDEAIAKVADQHVLPKVTDLLEKVCLQTTNTWGEKVGAPVTFIEYITQRAERYLTEEVDHDGKEKGDRGYGWSKHSTRVAYMVNQHLQYSIQRAMEKALKDANSLIVGGLEHPMMRVIPSQKNILNSAKRTRFNTPKICKVPSCRRSYFQGLSTGKGCCSMACYTEAKRLGILEPTLKGRPV